LSISSPIIISKIFNKNEESVDSLTKKIERELKKRVKSREAIEDFMAFWEDVKKEEFA